jgi:hypothetical protein
MNRIDLVDETFIAAPAPLLATTIADPARWAAWWPDLEASVFMDRGLEGLRWTVVGALVGTAEIWLESFNDGVIVHYFLRADPSEPGRPHVPRALPDSPRGRRVADRLRARRALAWKRSVWALKAELEGDRRPGAPGYR